MAGQSKSVSLVDEVQDNFKEVFIWNLLPDDRGTLGIIEGLPRNDRGR